MDVTVGKAFRMWLLQPFILAEAHFIVEMRGLNLIMSTVALLRVVEVKLSNKSELSILISKVNGWEYIFKSPG